VNETIVNEQIVLPVAKAADWTYVIICGPGTVMFAWAAIAILPEDFHDKGPLVDFTALAVFKVIAVLMAYVCGTYGYGALWRLLSPHPQMLATPSQIRFHPSLHRGSVPWQAVQSIAISEESPPKLVIRLRHRFWSPASPVTETKIVIPLMWLWSEEETQGYIVSLRRWHTEASA